jgi:hypothetical protein
MKNPQLDNLVDAGEQPQEPTLTLNVNINEINVILAALAELPHRVSDPIMRKLMEQAQGQLPKPN